MLRCREKGNWNLKFTESKYGTEVETEFWNVNLYMEKVNSDCHYWNVFLMKMRVLPLFLIPPFQNSLKRNMKFRLRLELGKANLGKGIGIYKKHICNVDPT